MIVGLWPQTGEVERQENQERRFGVLAAGMQSETTCRYMAQIGWTFLEEFESRGSLEGSGRGAICATRGVAIDSYEWSFDDEQLTQNDNVMMGSSHL